MKLYKLSQFFQNKNNQVLLVLLCIGTILRFFNLNWDNGQFLHPDERLYINAANLSFPHTIKELLSSTSPLNPHMFYYGSFPLYLYKIVATFIFHTDILIISRMISAFFSSLTICMMYLLSKQFFSEKIALLSAAIFVFTPGSIQYAHFNTTESLLIFFLTTITYLSSKLYFEEKLHLSVVIGILVGLSYATKIVGITFVFFPLLSLLLLFFQKPAHRLNCILAGLLTLLSALLAGMLLAPYQIIDWSSFIKEQNYMQGVTYGKFKPPFVIIYEGTLPYFYQLVKVLPFSYGLIALITSVLGIYSICKMQFAKKKIIILFLILFPLCYFLWSGAWFAKFSRYYLLLVPFLSIYAAFFIMKLKPFFRVVAIICIVLQGLLFFRIYMSPNTRIQASTWIENTIPPHAKIATEYWDDALPLHISDNYISQNISLSVYDEDTPTKVLLLSQAVAQCDYLILSSRRVYASILNNPQKYPYTSQFYKQLFAGELGFTNMKIFTSYPYLFADDFADESFQSYDHPPVIIFKNSSKYSPSLLQHKVYNGRF